MCTGCPIILRYRTCNLIYYLGKYIGKWVGSFQFQNVSSKWKTTIALKVVCKKPHFYMVHPVVYLLVPEMIFIFQYSMDISPFLLVQCWLKHHLFSSIILGRSNVVWRRLIMVFTPIFQLFCVKICLNSAWLTEKMLYSIAQTAF